MAEHVCPNGHEVPVLVALACPECPASVAYEPCSIGMALHRDLQGAVEACEAWREWERRAANEDEPELWHRFAVAMDELATTLEGRS